ncbi:hypothetical protein DOY81_013267 [Sarcophaga bullata]|nr:hypothetical protein DOY81_013267 [Sarcophaga bullata]
MPLSSTNAAGRIGSGHHHQVPSTSTIKSASQHYLYRQVFENAKVFWS